MSKIHKIILVASLTIIAIPLFITFFITPDMQSVIMSSTRL